MSEADFERNANVSRLKTNHGVEYERSGARGKLLSVRCTNFLFDAMRDHYAQVYD